MMDKTSTVLTMIIFGSNIGLGIYLNLLEIINFGLTSTVLTNIIL